MAEIEMGTQQGKERHSENGVIADDDVSRTLFDRVEEKLVQTLPLLASVDAEDLTRMGVSFKLALGHFLLYGALLGYFIITGTISEVGKKFLSLQDPGPSKAKCEAVRLVISGSYLADFYGVWSTQQAYDARHPLYELYFSSSQINLHSYSAAMLGFSSQLESLSVRSQGLDVLSSQALWTLAEAPNTEVKMQLHLFADMQQIFMSLREPPAPVLASRKGTCEAQLSAAYGYSTLLLTTSFPSSARPTAMPSQRPTTPRSPSLPPSPPSPVAFDDDGGWSYEPCPDQVHLNRYLAQDKTNVFGVAESTSLSFDMDLRCVATAYLLNFGIIDASALTVYREGNDGAGHYRVTYVSLNYPEMQPVECHTFPSKPRVCLAAGGSAGTGTFSYVYPVLSSSTWPGFREESPGRPCLCPQDQEDYFCNTGQYGQLTLVFSSTGTELDTIAMGWKLQQKIEADPGGANIVRTLIAGLGSTSIYVRRMISPSSYVNWLKGRAVMDKTVTPPQLVPLQTFKQYQADFDGLGKNMSLLVYELERLWGAKANLNAQGVALTSFATRIVNESSSTFGMKPTPQVMCLGLPIQPAALAAMAATPPVAIVQPYLSCSATQRAAFVTAVGVGAGNASLASTIFITLAVFLIVLHNNMRCGRQRKDTWFKVLPPARKAMQSRAADRLEKEALARDNALLALYVNQLRDAVVAAGITGLPPVPQVGALTRPPSHSSVLAHSERLSGHTHPRSSTARVPSPEPVPAPDTLCGDNPMHRTSGRLHA